MIGLIAFGSIALWLAASLWIAWRVAKFAKRTWLKALVMLTIAPLLVIAPLADEIVGKYQFERYCENAKEVKIYGTIPVGEELYTQYGKWRIASDPNMPLEERNRLNKLVESFVKWDLGPVKPKKLKAVIPINEYERKLYDAKTGRLLAEFRRYSNGGGWLARHSGLGGGSGGFLVPQSCAPAIVQENLLIQQLLPFSSLKEMGK